MCTSKHLNSYNIEQIDTFVLCGVLHKNFVSYVTSYVYRAT